MGSQVHWLVVPEGAERLSVHGDFVGRGDVLFRPVEGADVVAPVDGVFIGSGRVGPFAVVEGLVEDFVGESPVGRSFEVRAADETVAREGARIKAAQADIRVGRVLFVEQVEAGVWEVVLVSLVERPEPELTEAEAGALREYMIGVELALVGEELKKEVRRAIYSLGVLYPAEVPATADRIIELVWRSAHGA